MRLVSLDCLLRRLLPLAAAGILVSTSGSGNAVRAAGPVTHTVIMEELGYQPEHLTVNAGDRVVWVNKDMFPHTATSENGGFDSGLIAADTSWEYTTAEKGEFPYICTYHPTMKGTLRVK